MISTVVYVCLISAAVAYDILALLAINRKVAEAETVAARTSCGTLELHETETSRPRAENLLSLRTKRNQKLRESATVLVTAFFAIAPLALIAVNPVLATRILHWGALFVIGQAVWRVVIAVAKSEPAARYRDERAAVRPAYIDR